MFLTETRQFLINFAADISLWGDDRRHEARLFVADDESEYTLAKR